MRRTSCWNHIKNKHYWPKTGRSSQKQNMWQKQSSNLIDPKTNYKITYQKISIKHLEQIMFNQILKLISIPIEKNFRLKPHNKWTPLTQNRQIQSKTKHVSKAISKTKLIQKQITKFPTKRYQWNILEQVIFNQMINLISIPIEKNLRGADDMSSGRGADDIWKVCRWHVTNWEELLTETT